MQKLAITVGNLVFNILRFGSIYKNVKIQASLKYLYI